MNKFLLVSWLVLFSSLGHAQPYFYDPPPPFEKIYIDPSALVTFHDGTYYFDEYGCKVKVKALKCDSDGRTYILMVYHQCPSCGKCWTNLHPPEEGYLCSHVLENSNP
jgi:hypothetical protein